MALKPDMVGLFRVSIPDDAATTERCREAFSEAAKLANSIPDGQLRDMAKASVQSAYEVCLLAIWRTMDEGAKTS